MLPPTSQLPPIKAIKFSSFDILQNSVEYIRRLYIPPVRGSLRRIKRTDSPGSLVNESSEPQLLYWDTFERGYAMRWLTALITHYGSDSHSDLEEEGQDNCRENLIRSAASLLATCAGTASAGTIVRNFVFEIYPVARRDEQTCTLRASSVVIELRDIPLDNNDYRSVGGQTWGGACLMADMIAENPLSFGIPALPSPRLGLPFSFRCIELGAGTGLVSLVIGKVLEHQYSAQLPLSCKTRPTDLPTEVEIVVTDYYPAVLENLQKNMHANFATDIPIQISSQWLDWSIFSMSAPMSDPPVLQEQFDSVYGTDIIYESQHAQWVKGCLEKLLRKPSKDADIDPAFHLIIPLRRTHAAESNTVELVFRTAMQNQTQPAGDCDELLIKHKETIICDSENYSTEEIEYIYYKIGWGSLQS